MKTPAWRESVLKKIAADNYPLVSTSYFREVCYTCSTQEKGKPIKQRMADSYLKQLVDEGTLQIASKGLFLNKMSTNDFYLSDVVASIMRNWGRGENVILSGPWSLAGEIPETGPILVHTDARLSTVQVGLLGYEKDDPRGHCYVISSMPQTFKNFEAFRGKSRVVQTSDHAVSYELASPEKALMLMAVQTSGQNRLDFTGAVKVVGIDDRIRLEITNPLTGEVTQGSVDPELLSMRSGLEPPRTESGQRGKDYSARVELLTSGSPGMSILEAVDHWTAQNQTEDSIYSLEDNDLSPDDLMPYGDEPEVQQKRGR